MNTDISKAPEGKEVILYLENGWPPIVAGYFQDTWQTEDGKEVAYNRIIGWEYIPHMPPGYY